MQIQIAVDATNSSEVITCDANAGKSLIARYPQKLFISFQATSTTASKFYIQARYDAEYSGKSFDNFDLCSDRGEKVMQDYYFNIPNY